MDGMEDDLEVSRDLIDFIASCPSMFHTTRTIAGRLEAAGFEQLPEGEEWHLEPGGTYYATRNGSSVIALRVGDAIDVPHFQMTAAHGDSPTFKLKDAPALEGPEGTLRLNVEAYGGMIDHTWFDRPLSVAGRVMVRDGSTVRSRLLAPDRDLVLIPSLAIHMDHDVNKGFAPNRQVDLCPLFSAGELKAADVDRLIAGELGVEPHDVLGRDLFLVNRQPGCVWGAASEFVSSPKLDDLQCAYASLVAFLTSRNESAITVYCCFDNEEVGSNTKQGALSTFLHDVLLRSSLALGMTEEGYLRALSRSFLVSCDNAHAVHPNHPERADDANRCRLNGGLVVKEAANQLYTTDAFSRSVFRAVCDDAGVPLQHFANRSDMQGGSTLGNLSNTQVSVHAVDVGLPQLAMHSSYETTGSHDTALGIRALRAFLSTNVAIEGAESATLG
ncbi:M18 family aminopeptidase [Olsenella porci]|jgi:aspartyl aminopeptidase|nr:M18 family aminopeptidase [Olsenella porci]